MNNTKLIIVVPCYNEEEVLQETTRQLSAVLSDMEQNGKITEGRLMYVDDGSRDATWHLIEQLSTENPRVMGLKLAHNVGHQQALWAGLEWAANAPFDAIVSIDADLQDDVQAIVEMTDRFNQGIDIVYGVRKERKTDTFFKKHTAQAFYKLMQTMGGDVVYNHATGSFPMAKMYWNGSNTAENNPWFNVVAKHDYNVFHDINHDSPIIRDYFKRNLVYLLEEYNIDGFRFDLTKGFTQNNTLGDVNAWGQKDDSRIAILKDYADAVWAYDQDAVVIFEHLADKSEEKVLAEYGIQLWRNMQWIYGQTAMGWNDGGRPTDFSGMYSGTSDMPFGSLVGYMESHDEERCSCEVQKWGNGDTKTNIESRMKRLALNAAFFLTVPGPKMIWQFGELGYDLSINYPSDTEADRTSRKPAKWEYLDEPARKGLYDAYSKLLAFRRTYPRFFDSDAKFTWKVTSSYWNNRYIHCTDAEGNAFVVVGNFDIKSADVTVPLPSHGNWKEYDGTRSWKDVSQISIPLESAEYKILVNF